MKLLFDENLSPRLVDLLATEFPGSHHIDSLGMRGTTDPAIWEYAREHDYIIVSKDGDFRQRSFLSGPPPKAIWVRVGNTGTLEIAALLRRSQNQIQAFADDAEQGLLVVQSSHAQ